MKRVDSICHLERHGCEFLRQGMLENARLPRLSLFFLR